MAPVDETCAPPRDEKNENDTQLPLRHMRFLLAYLEEPHVGRAAKRAGYTTKYGQALLKTPLVKAEIMRREKEAYATVQEKLGITAERVAREVCAMAFSRMADYVAIENGAVCLKDTAALSAMQHAAISHIKEGPRGCEVHVYDKFRALEWVSDKLALFAGGDEAQNKREMNALRQLFLEQMSQA